MREMKDSGIEWIDEIPFTWNVNRIKYLFFSTKGLSITKENLLDEGLPVISYGQIHSKSNSGVDINDDLLRYVSFEYKTSNPQCEVKMSDFIFADTSEDYEGCGNCIYKRDDSELFAGYHSIILHALFQDDKRYLAYLFKTDAWRKQIRTLASGVKVYSITQKMITNAQIIEPPIEEQKIIADYLDKICFTIDALITDIQSEIDILVEYKKSIITETVTKGLNPNTDMKKSGAGWMPVVPKHWKVEKFKYHFNIREDKGYPDAQVLSLYRDYGVIPKDSRDDNHNVTSEDTSKYKYVKRGYFVINKMKAWQGSVAVSEHEGIISPAYYIYEFKDNLYNKQYFHYLMRNKSYTTEYRRLSGGIREGQWDLSREGLNNILVLIPPMREQEEIVKYLDRKSSEIDSVIESKRKQLDTLAEYKKSLIYEYVTGKKEVG